MKEIIIVRKSGDKLVVNVDDEDYKILSGYNWRALVCRSGNTYAIRHATKQEKDEDYPSDIIMHRQILEMVFRYDLEVDHKNGNGLDNRKENLRLVTRSENNMNRIKKRFGTSSVYKGVSWDKEKKRWEAHIRYKSKKNHIGYYRDEIDAAIAYNNKAKELFGEFAQFNNT